jgi:hypothetical protein
MISYARLATEIYEILSAPTYHFNLKMYSPAGDSTYTPRNAKWIYVQPEDIIIRFPIDGNNSSADKEEVYFWKNHEIDPDKVTQIIDRIRKICTLYGIGLTVKDFARSEMKKRFSTMTAKETAEDKMNESMDFETRGVYVPEEGEYVRILPRMIHGERPAIVTGIHYDRYDEASHVFVKFPNGQEAIYAVGDVEFDEYAEDDFVSADDTEEYGNDDYLSESMTGTQKKSFFTLENARMVIVHESLIDEEKRGARTRNIKEMYVESNGERFRIPKNFLSAGKAMTRHLNEGGTVLDTTGRRIMEVAKEAGDLIGFLREYKKSKKQSLLEMAMNRVRSIRTDCSRLSGPKGYSKLKEEFTKKKRIGKERINEMKNHIISELGLNESAKIHEGIDHLARLKVMETSTDIDKVAQVLDHLRGSKEHDKKETDNKTLAKHLVLGTVKNSLSSDDKNELSHLAGTGVKKLWKENGGKIADSFQKITASIKDDFLFNLFSSITDKIVNGSPVKVHELAIANLIKDGVLNVSSDSTMAGDVLESVTAFVNKTTFAVFEGLDDEEEYTGSIFDILTPEEARKTTHANGKTKIAEHGKYVLFEDKEKEEDNVTHSYEILRFVGYLEVEMPSGKTTHQERYAFEAELTSKLNKLAKTSANRIEIPRIIVRLFNQMMNNID